MKRKAIALLLAMAMCTTALAGCGKGNNGADSSKTSAPEASADTTD